jgi:hypothetical protein
MRAQRFALLTLAILVAATFAAPAQAAHHRRHHKYAHKRSQSAAPLTLSAAEPAVAQYVAALTTIQERNVRLAGATGFGRALTCELFPHGGVILESGAYSVNGTLLSPLPGEMAPVKVSAPFVRCVVTVPLETQPAGLGLSCHQYLYAWSGSAPKLPFPRRYLYRYGRIFVEAYWRNGCFVVNGAVGSS